MNANPPGVDDDLVHLDEDLAELAELEQELADQQDPDLPPATPAGQHQTHSEPVGTN
ncbi:hypothetical protein [Saccharothrix syringae]|uniref:hypothetical protein n=1 Tax=Saccharothrix syringae TaxID=103733 RepID=UPI000AC20DF7|nr:hypothetical protein [Saccharothrix syringae]